VPRIRPFPDDLPADIAPELVGENGENEAISPAFEAISTQNDVFADSDGADDPTSLPRRIAQALRANGATRSEFLLALWQERAATPKPGAARNRAKRGTGWTPFVPDKSSFL
jgi:hypothetical protein